MGSRFDIYLPAVEGPARADSEPAEDPAPPRGSETILIVEDEDLVCKIAKRSLAQAGYEVLTASGGEQALELAQSHAGPIDLLLTDVVLPHTNGRELAERLGELRPEMKIIYMSGYADGAIARHGVLEEGINFLPKPFTPRSLNRMVGNVLAAEAET